MGGEVILYASDWVCVLGKNPTRTAVRKTRYEKTIACYSLK